MQKRALLLLTLLTSINLVSAASIGEFFDRIGEENILLGGIFIIAFAMLHMALSKVGVFKDASGKKTSAPTIISLIISIFIVFYAYRSNFSLENLGIPSEYLYILLLLLIIGGIIYAVQKLKDTWVWENKCPVLLFIGIASIGVSLNDSIQRPETLFFIGTVLIIASIVCWVMGRKKKDEEGDNPDEEEEGEERRNNRGRNGFKKITKWLQKNKCVIPLFIGLILLGISLNDSTQEKETYFILGILFMIGSLICWIWSRKKPNPIPPKKRSLARFDIIMGGKERRVGGDDNMYVKDLFEKGSLNIGIKNGGSGGNLVWKAATSKGLGISKTSGKLATKKSETITITITNQNALDEIIDYGGKPHLTIMGKAGADNKTGASFIRKTIGKLRVYFA